MAFNTGDITEITCTHPTLGNFSFQAKKGADWTYDLGGPKTLDNDDDITGAGEPIYTVEQTKWFIEGEVVWDMITRDELDSLTALSGSPVEGQWTINCINGDVRSASGKPVGDIQSTNKGVIAIKISGGGKLKKIG